MVLRNYEYQHKRLRAKGVQKRKSHFGFKQIDVTKENMARYLVTDRAAVLTPGIQSRTSPGSDLPEIRPHSAFRQLHIRLRGLAIS